MAVNIFEHDDGAVNQHADRKRYPGQTDHVQVTPHQRHKNKGADDADRYGAGNDERGGKISQKNQQYNDSEGSTDEYILADQINGASNIGPLIIYPVELDLFRRQFFGVQALDHSFQSIGKLEDVSVRFRFDPDGNSFLSHMHHGSRQFFITEFNRRQIRHPNTLLTGGTNDDVFNVGG